MVGLACSLDGLGCRARLGVRGGVAGVAGVVDFASVAGVAGVVGVVGVAGDMDTSFRKRRCSGVDFWGFVCTHFVGEEGGVLWGGPFAGEAPTGRTMASPMAG